MECSVIKGERNKLRYFLEGDILVENSPCHFPLLKLFKKGSVSLDIE